MKKFLKKFLDLYKKKINNFYLIYIGNFLPTWENAMLKNSEKILFLDY